MTADNEFKRPENYDCGNLGFCKKLYGDSEGKKFWCAKCAANAKLFKEMEVPKPKYVPKTKVCPECGISVKNLSYHLGVHTGQREVCPHCAKEVRNLQVHLKNVHTKLPCPQCGKLIGAGIMNRLVWLWNLMSLMTKLNKIGL